MLKSFLRLFGCFHTNKVSCTLHFASRRQRRMRRQSSLLFRR